MCGWLGEFDAVGREGAADLFDITPAKVDHVLVDMPLVKVEGHVVVLHDGPTVCAKIGAIKGGFAAAKPLQNPLGG